MTDSHATGILINVATVTSCCTHRLVTDRLLPLLPGRPRRAERIHRDPSTDIAAVVLVFSDDGETTGWLAPNPDLCPLCAGTNGIVVRRGSLPRDKKGDVDYPIDLLLDHANGLAELPQDTPVDVLLPCPLCRSIDYAMQMDDEIGCV